MATNAREAIGEAIAIVEEFGHVDGGHHKAWVIDQMVRALTGVDYEVWRAAYEASGDEWSEGVAP